MPRRHAQVEIARPPALPPQGLLVRRQLSDVEPGLEGVTVAGVDDHPHVRVGVRERTRDRRLLAQQLNDVVPDRVEAYSFVH